MISVQAVLLACRTAIVLCRFLIGILRSLLERACRSLLLGIGIRRGRVTSIRRGGVWPPHCVQGSKGAEFHPDLKISNEAIVVSKGTAVDEDSYSAFAAADARGVALKDLLRQRGIERIYVGGLATDYCVKETVLEGLMEGFKVVLLQDAVCGVNLQPEDSAQAMDAMVKAGVGRTSRRQFSF